MATPEKTSLRPEEEGPTCPAPSSSETIASGSEQPIDDAQAITMQDARKSTEKNIGLPPEAPSSLHAAGVEHGNAEDEAAAAQLQATAVIHEPAAAAPTPAILPLDWNDPAWDEPPPRHDPVDMESEKLADLVPRLREVIRLRDEAIRGEQRQVRLYEAKNEALRANLDQVEAEVGSLQAALTQANDRISVSTKEKRKLEKRVASLEAMLDGVKGQEYAINVATSQNTKLVLLLQEEERKQKEVEKERQGHLDEIAGLRAKLSTATREFSVVETKIKDQLRRRSYHYDKLQGEHDQLKGEHTALQHKYEEETGDLKARVAGLEKQVYQLKGQPYKLLDRLQKAEDGLRAAKDESERVQREAGVLEEQNAELSRHLEEAVGKANTYKDKLEAMQRSVPTLEKEVASLRSRLEFERRDKAALEAQLFDMSQSITQLVRRQAEVEGKAVRKENELFRVIQGKDHEGKTQEQQLSAKDRLVAKQQKAIAVLEQAVAEAKAEAEALRGERKKRGEALDPTLPFRLEVQGAARHRLLDLHVATVAMLAIAEPTAHVVVENLSRLRGLDLSSCAMTDAELGSLLHTLRLCPEVRALDVSSNAITDEGSYALSDYLRAKTCHLQRLVLRHNQLTAQAIRRLAVALESNSARRVRQVVLRKEGLIEAYADPPSPPSTRASEEAGDRQQDGDTSRRSSAARPLPSVSGSSSSSSSRPADHGGADCEPAIVVDARDNMLGPRKLSNDDTSSPSPRRLLKLAAERTTKKADESSSPGRRPGGKEGGKGKPSAAEEIQLQREFRHKATARAYSAFVVTSAATPEPEATPSPHRQASQR